MRIAAIVTGIGFLGVAVFQAALALGAPLGQAAWGGAHRRLPTPLRMGSAIAILVWLAAASIVLAEANFDVPAPPAGIRRWAIWVVVALLAVGTLMNAASRSRWERFLWAPISLILALLTTLITIG